MEQTLEASQETTAKELLNALRLGIANTFNISLRGVSITVRPLSISETISTMNRARADFSKRPAEEQSELALSYLLAAYQLELASTASDAPNAKPVLSTYVLNRLTNDEIAALHRAYLEGCDKFDPSIETITQERLYELIEQVKKKELQPTKLSRSVLEKMVLHFCSEAI